MGKMQEIICALFGHIPERHRNRISNGVRFYSSYQCSRCGKDLGVKGFK